MIIFTAYDKLSPEDEARRINQLRISVRENADKIIRREIPRGGELAEVEQYLP